MAAFVLMNVAILGVVVVAGQHKLIGQVRERVSKTNLLTHYVRPFKHSFGVFRHGIYNLMRTGAPIYAFLIVVLIGASFVANPNEVSSLKELEPAVYKFTGGFYTGVYLPEVQATGDVQGVTGLEKTDGPAFNLVALHQVWGPAAVDSFPQKLLEGIYRKNAVPMITWEPWTHAFPALAGHPELGRNRKVMKAISERVFDDYLKAYAQKIRALNRPVFIRFAHEFDNPAYPWSPAGGNTPDEFIAAWQHVVVLFNNEGVSNVAWVWNPSRATAIDPYFPGQVYVDWVGVTCLNYGAASAEGKWRSYEEIYAPYRRKLLGLEKPVMLAEFGAAAQGGDPVRWTADALNAMGEKHPEVKAAVFVNRTRNQAAAWRPVPEASPASIRMPKLSLLAESLENVGEAATFRFDGPARLPRVRPGAPAIDAEAPSYPRVAVAGTPGHYQLLVNGKPFYVRGIAYNTAHDWRDGHYPLSRKQIERDLKDIKDMGVNTIRRYNPSVYDRNILAAARTHNLKVWYGFWFDPEVDYYRDSAQVEKYLERVEETVRAHKDDPSILCWSVGNETWGLLKQQYQQPYLTVVRSAYAAMIERMARRIHEIDPHRPVSTSFEHALQLPAEMASFHENAPSVDIIGVNSYYIEQISQLNGIATRFDSTRPYVVSEFGPNGYWDAQYSHFTDDKLLQEDPDFVKAVYYSKQWTDYVQRHQGDNVGGVAFCWRDRMEGTATWFGITDYKGRKKPAYYTLRKLWTGKTNYLGRKERYNMHNMVLTGPSGKLEAGQTYTFTARTERLVNSTLEWVVYKEDYLRKAGKVEVLPDGKTARVTFTEPGEHRLYVYMHDYVGNVVTASIPVTVAQPDPEKSSRFPAILP
jgi:plastocyanin